MPAQRLAPDLRRAVQCLWANVVVGEPAKVGRHPVVLTGRYVRVGWHALEAAYGVAAGREHDPLGPGLAGGLEYVVRAQNVAGVLAFPVLRPEIGRQVDDDLLALEGRANCIQIGYISLYGWNAIDGTAVQRGQFVPFRFEQVVLQQTADQPAHPGYQHFLHGAGLL